MARFFSTSPRPRRYPKPFCPLSFILSRKPKTPNRIPAFNPSLIFTQNLFAFYLSSFPENLRPQAENLSFILSFVLTQEPAFNPFIIFTQNRLWSLAVIFSEDLRPKAENPSFSLFPKTYPVSFNSSFCKETRL